MISKKARSSDNIKSSNLLEDQDNDSSFKKKLSKLPKISIVITTKNEERNIEICLKSIKLQTYSNIEIIVVDNGSTDITKELALKYTDKVFDKWPERSAQRNLWMRDKSTWEFVMYVDADMIFAPDLIENVLEFMQENHADAVYISEVILWSSYWSKVRRFEREFYDGSVIDCARIFRKDFFVRIWGFDESMAGPEDWDLDRKARDNGKVLLMPKWALTKKNNWDMYIFINQRWINPNNHGNVIFHNESEFDVPKYLAKKWYYAQSFDKYITKRWRNDKDIRKQFWFYYRYFWVFIEKWKWKNLFSHPFLAFGMYWLRFMVGIKFIQRKFAKKVNSSDIYKKK